MQEEMKECKYYYNCNSFGGCNNFEDEHFFCEDNKGTCYFKQLQQAKKEIKELKKQLSTVKNITDCQREREEKK